MEKVNTDPCLYHLMLLLWHVKQPSFEKNDPTNLIKIWNILQEIDTAATWIGILPLNLCSKQNRYSNIIGIKSNGEKWRIELMYKVLRATLQLWLQKNEIVHAQTKEGVKGIGEKHCVQR